MVVFWGYLEPLAASCAPQEGTYKPSEAHADDETVRFHEVSVNTKKKKGTPLGARSQYNLKTYLRPIRTKQRVTRQRLTALQLLHVILQ